MQSGHGVRVSGASIVSSRYSHEEFSDQEPDGAAYTASFAASDTLGYTHSTFGLGEDISTNFESERQQDNYSRTLEVENSIADSLQSSVHAPAVDWHNMGQPGLQQSVQGKTAADEDVAHMAGFHEFPSRSASQLSSHSNTLCASPDNTGTAAYEAPAPQGRVSSNRLDVHASADGMKFRKSTDSGVPADTQQLRQQTHQKQLQADALLPPRPSSSSPVKRPHSRSRSHRHHPSSRSSNGIDYQQPSSTAAASQQARNLPEPPQQQAAEISNREGVQMQRISEHRRQQQGQQQPHQSDKKPNRQKEPPPPQYEGDLSEWGKTVLEDFYDDDDDQSITSSHLTMSSGLGPRDTRPRVRAFEAEAARETFAYNAGMYSRAQALRRDGTAPAAMGVADDLPTRMAYQQLNVLAGMAGKVQDAILHNKRIFEQRMMQEDRFLMRKVFDGWRAVRFGSVAKQQKVRKAAARILKGALSRAFFAWKDELHIVDKNLAMKRKVSATIACGLLKRSFLAWQHLAQERWWKNQLVMREREVTLLETKIRGYEKRPIQVLKKRKLGAVLQAWLQQAAHRQEKRRKLVRAGRFWANQQLSKAWTSWVDATEQAARRRVLSQKVVARVQKLETCRAWNSWLEVVDAQRKQSSKVCKAAQHWKNSMSSKAWRTWVQRAAQSKSHKQIAKRWMQPGKAKAFAGWVDYIAWTKRNRLLVGRALAKLRHGMLASAFIAWIDVVDDRKTEVQLTTTEGLRDSLSKLQAENERLRRDNERFVRLIDSGEWGRGRVAELVSAGEVMQAERDALLKLISSLRREYEAVQMAKNQQEEELKHLKDKMTVGGSARNRLLVKGGSSFNALVRAMKQDLVENGTVAKDPALLYEIDKLSMDRVQVFPDGELNVQAITTAGSSAAFARPVTKGRAGGAAAAVPGSPVHRAYSGSPRASPSPTHSGIQSAGHYTSAGGSSTGGFGNSTPGIPAAAACGVGGLHTVTSVGATPLSSAAASGAADMLNQQVLRALSNLTPAQLNQLETTARQSAAAASAPVSSAGGAGGRPSPLAGRGRAV